jgi:N-acetylmuramoyl-L-alanine amidase
VGLVAGHSGGIDTGAVCQDGLREVDITVDVAQRTKKLLEGHNYRVDILAEFDPKLNATRRDYAPRAFLAIHADSCITYASGFKVARAANSYIPQEDDRLVRCMTSAYAAVTHLPFHSNSITSDMTLYHGLNEINSKTPGAIIELGFLGSEYNLLKNRRDLLAAGVADGLIAFLRGDPCE